MEESAFPKERRSNQRTFQSGGDPGPPATSCGKGTAALLVSYANGELPPGCHYGFIFFISFFIFFNVIIVSGF